MEEYKLCTSAHPFDYNFCFFCEILELRSFITSVQAFLCKIFKLEKKKPSFF